MSDTNNFKDNQLSIRELFKNQPIDYNYVKTGNIVEQTYYPEQTTTLKRSKTSRDFSDGLQEYLYNISSNQANTKCNTCGRYMVHSVNDRYDFLLCTCPVHTKKSRSYSNISDLTDRHSEDINYYDNRSSSSDTESTQNSRIIRFTTKM